MEYLPKIVQLRIQVFEITVYQAWFLDANHARTRVHGVGDDARTGTQH